MKIIEREHISDEEIIAKSAIVIKKCNRNGFDD